MNDLSACLFELLLKQTSRKQKTCFQKRTRPGTFGRAGKVPLMPIARMRYFGWRTLWEPSPRVTVTVLLVIRYVLQMQTWLDSPFASLLVVDCIFAVDRAVSPDVEVQSVGIVAHKLGKLLGGCSKCQARLCKR